MVKLVRFGRVVVAPRQKPMADSTFAALSVARPRPARLLHLRTNHALSLQCLVVNAVREWDGSRAGLGAWWRGLVGWLVGRVPIACFPRLRSTKKRRWSCGSQPGRPATGACRGCQGSLQGRGCGCVSGGPRHAGSHGEAWRVRGGVANGQWGSCFPYCSSLRAKRDPLLGPTSPTPVLPVPRSQRTCMCMECLFVPTIWA